MPQPSPPRPLNSGDAHDEHSTLTCTWPWSGLLLAGDPSSTWGCVALRESARAAAAVVARAARGGGAAAGAGAQRRQRLASARAAPRHQRAHLDTHEHVCGAQVQPR
jgi:hypothetical protein